MQGQKGVKGIKRAEMVDGAVGLKGLKERPGLKGPQNDFKIVPQLS